MNSIVCQSPSFLTMSPLRGLSSVVSSVKWNIHKNSMASSTITDQQKTPRNWHENHQKLLGEIVAFIPPSNTITNPEKRMAFLSSVYYLVEPGLLSPWRSAIQPELALTKPASGNQHQETTTTVFFPTAQLEIVLAFSCQLEVYTLLLLSGSHFFRRIFINLTNTQLNPFTN